MLNVLRTLFIGIMVGVANVIPGVSGGTLVVVFNIYDKFLDIMSFKFKKIIKNWKFVLPLVIGMLGGILVFSKVIGFLFEKFPLQTYFCFIGLVAGSIPMLLGYMLKKRPGETKLSAGRITGTTICAILGFALMIGFTILQMKFGDSDISFSELPAIKPSLLVIIFFAGILGAMAMVIPGISGSLIMLILGIYPIVIAAIPIMVETLFKGEWGQFSHALFLLLPNGVGLIIGLITGARLISYLLRKAPHFTYAVIFGLICGSIVNLLIVCWNKYTEVAALVGVGTIIGCIICFAAGFALAYFSTKLAPEENGDKKEEIEVQEKTE